MGAHEVPYASRARALRQLLQAQPWVKLPEWARRELLRILPELARRGESPPPLTTEEEKLRFYDAQSTAMRLLCQDYAAVLLNAVCPAACVRLHLPSHRRERRRGRVGYSPPLPVGYKLRGIFW